MEYEIITLFEMQNLGACLASKRGPDNAGEFAAYRRSPEPTSIRTSPVKGMNALLFVIGLCVLRRMATFSSYIYTRTVACTA